MNWKKDLPVPVVAGLIVYGITTVLALLTQFLSGLSGVLVGVLPGVLAFVVAALIIVVLRRSQPEPKPPIVKESAKRPIIVVLPKPQPEPKPPIVEGSAERPTKESPTWAFDGIIEVHGQRERIRADLRAGNVIRGTLEETGNQLFDFLVFDEENYVEFSKDRDKGDAALELCDEHTYLVKWTVGHDGVWYFVFDKYLKQNDRTIHVILKECSKS